MNTKEIFSIRTKKDFEKFAIKVFHFQFEHCEVYKRYIRQLNIKSQEVRSVEQIPFLPIEFFKTHNIISDEKRKVDELFLSSGTTGSERSRHHVADISLYEKSFRTCFKNFYGDVKQYAVLALLPSYYENKNSSLLYMVKDLIVQSRNNLSAFYNAKDENIIQAIKNLLSQNQKVFLIGVSFALLDLAEKLPGIFSNTKNLIVMETGGMKGRREEITREELHKILCKKFGVKKIHSEYGMTELLSQAYSAGNGLFESPPWMKILVRDVNDPFQIFSSGKIGGLNIIDLANINSCSFIATQDVGKIHKNGTFEVLGRIDNSDLRGCNLLAT